MLQTRLTDKLNLKYPIVQAPMAFAAGGKLASAVSAAGGLGLIGGAYGDIDWINEQFRQAGNQPVGCGLITWALKDSPQALNAVLAHEPKAMFLSFSDPKPYIETIRQIDTCLFCQVQTLRDALRAIEVGVDVIVAQGSEAGGHGECRGTFTLVPEVADAIEKHSPDTLLCAAGGIMDGRGLAAALALGADGVLCGSRFWASHEANVHPKMLQRALDSDGDHTIRSSVMDIARKLEWPTRYSARVLKNSFTEKWHDDIAGLIENAEVESARWKEAWVAGDVDVANTFVGEGTGLIRETMSAADLLSSMSTEAERIIGQQRNFLS